MDAGPVLSLAAVAGEKSGDLLGASVLAALGRHDRSLQCAGIGGAAMVGAGLERWWDISALSVSGYVEVLREYPRLHRMREDLIARVRAWRPSCFLGIDAPDFNLAIEARLRRDSIPVVHFISPSIWAWRRGRIDQIKNAVDHMLLVFPHEQEIYRQAGIPATYVGHPMADLIALTPAPQRARAELGIGEDVPVLALLPGSRNSELKYLLGPFVATAAWIHARRPEFEFVLPAASGGHYDRIVEWVRAAHLPESLRLRIVSGGSHNVLEACDAALVASGTATLETALFKKPMVIAYRMAWSNYRIMRRMAYLPHVGLPNILCAQAVVPEFIQEAVEPAAMGAALLAQVDDQALQRQLVERFTALHVQLRRGCAQRAAEIIVDVADG
jgi:lipid-A-disaccharide synthase